MNKAASAIFSQPAHFFPRTHARDKEPSLLRFLKTEDSETYPIFAPVLFLDLNTANRTLVFERQLYLRCSHSSDIVIVFWWLNFKILWVFLFGEGSLNAGQIAGKCVGNIWGVRKITESSVALASVVVSLPPTQCYSCLSIHYIGKIYSICRHRATWIRRKDWNWICQGFPLLQGIYRY